jgi:hypothetical protein
MLSMPPQFWPERVKADRANPRHFYKGRAFTFDELVALRADEKLAKQITPEVFQQRHQQCQRAIHVLADEFVQRKPDVAVIVGNDQMEILTREHVPAFLVFWGEYVEGIPRTPEFLATLPPGIAPAELDRTPSVYTRYPCLPELGEHLIKQVVAENFDVAQMTRFPTGEVGSNAAPHAFGFVYRRLMRDAVIPHAPVFVNTFYPPNQPTVARCFAFGRALARAIASWPSNRTVAVIGSGGLSHWVIDEKLDHTILHALKTGDYDTLLHIPETIFQAGTSETKNWIAVAGIMAEAGLRMDLVDYVPCYRSEAGTGNAMGFAIWK